MRDQAFYKMGINQEDIDKLNVIPFFCSVVGIFVNILLLAAISNFAWLEGTAMRDGQPYQVHLSLGAAIFGPPSDPTRDNKFFCDRSSCSLKSLCQDEPGTELFENGDAKYTSASTWCSAANAGSLVGGLLG